MAARIVVGVFQSEGIAEDARNRLKTEGVPTGDLVLKVLKEIGPIPEVMEPELDAGFLGPMMLGNFRQTLPITSATERLCFASRPRPTSRSNSRLTLSSNTRQSRSRSSRLPARISVGAM